MKIILLVLVLLYLFKTNPAGIKDILLNLDIPSFAPLFKILGLDEKTIAFLTSEKFSETLSDIAQNDLSGAKALLPLLFSILSPENKDKKDEKDEKKSAAESSPADGVNAEYFNPVKEIIPDDISENLSGFFS